MRVRVHPFPPSPESQCVPPRFSGAAKTAISTISIKGADVGSVLAYGLTNFGSIKTSIVCIVFTYWIYSTIRKLLEYRYEDEMNTKSICETNTPTQADTEFENEMVADQYSSRSLSSDPSRSTSPSAASKQIRSRGYLRCSRPSDNLGRMSRRLCLVARGMSPWILKT